MKVRLKLPYDAFFPISGDVYMTNDNHNKKGSRLKRLFSSVKKLF